jgi:hypothetical protein
MVHVDEKWFYLAKINQKIYLVPGETGPTRPMHSKRFIPKVMFLAAVAEPRTNVVTGERFDGKIGIWPFVEIRPAARKSKNRPKGSPITHSILVTREVYRKTIVERVIPAIKAVWPGPISEPIRIQQDNARPHALVADAEVTLVGKEGGWDIDLVNQPASSPDLNVLDLGYFNAIQSLQYEKVARNIDELVEAVQESFRELSYDKLENNFCTLRSVMRAIIEHKGGNGYKIPHSAKARARAEGFFGEPEFVALADVEAADDQLSDMYSRITDERSVADLCELFNTLGVPDDLEIDNGLGGSADLEIYEL